MDLWPKKSLILSKITDNISDILGHVSVQTTEMYARADSKLKRESLEKASRDIFDKEISVLSWEKDKKLKLFLKGLA